jgi:ribosomal protein S19E (S16A)
VNIWRKTNVSKEKIPYSIDSYILTRMAVLVRVRYALFICGRVYDVKRMILRAKYRIIVQ